MEKKGRVSISLKTKLLILNELQDGKTPTEICRSYNIHKSTLTRIKNNKENFEEFASKTYVNQKKIKRMKPLKNPDLDDKLYAWFLLRREANELVSNEMLKVKALDLKRSLNVHEEFSASDGWLDKFKKRHGIRILTVSGEKLSCNAESAATFTSDFKKIIAENGFLPEQIYNCDETGLVYKGLHKKTNATVFEKTAVGRKSMKERVTIMPCVNATGTHKLDLMMIGKSKNPRCFKNVNLPLYYKSSKNAWQTSALFKEWYNDLFIPEVSRHLEAKGLPVKAILLVDNATCHGTANTFSHDENFKVIFFPPNNTPLLQPLDQNVIKSLKQRYRKHLLSTLLALCVNGNNDMVSALKNINLKDVAFLIVEAWNDVPRSVVMSSFKHLFSSIDAIEFNIPENHFVEEDDIPLARLYNLVIENDLTENEIMEWATGSNERSVLFEIEDEIANDESIANEEGHMEEESRISIDNVIDSFNTAVEWAEENNLTSNEILFLRRIREKAVLKRLN